MNAWLPPPIPREFVGSVFYSCPVRQRRLARLRDAMARALRTFARWVEG